MEIKLDLSIDDMNYLAHTRCENFLNDQPDRFLIWDSELKGEPLPVGGHLAFFNHLIEAKLFMLTKQQMFGTNCMMFLDEAWEPDKPMVYPNGPHFCIWIDEPVNLVEGDKEE